MLKLIKNIVRDLDETGAARDEDLHGDDPIA